MVNTRLSLLRSSFTSSSKLTELVPPLLVPECQSLKRVVPSGGENLSLEMEEGGCVFKYVEMALTFSYSFSLEH